jgi:hypothetical protein
MGTPAFGMNGTLRNALAILRSKLLNELIVLQENRATWAGGEGVLIVGDGRSGGRGKAVSH